MFELKMASKYIKGRSGFISLIGGFSLSGIAIGVATLITVMSVMNGFHDKLTEYIVGVSGHISVLAADGGYMGTHQEVVQQIRSISGVKSAVPTYSSEVVLMADDRVSGVYLTGLDIQSMALDKPIIASAIKRGSLEQLQQQGGISIGAELARILRVNIGDTVTVISPKSLTTIIGTMPNMKEYNVSAIFNIGMLEYDSRIAYMDLREINTLFDAPDPDSINSIEVTLLDTNKTADIAKIISSVTPPPWTVRTWHENNAQFMSALRIERVVMFLILTLIIVVAAFNIISSLVILAQEKKKEIAILKTMGASNASIVAIFLMCGLFVGSTGTIAGIIIGLSFAYNIGAIKDALEHASGMILFDPLIYFFSDLPSKVHTSDVIWIAAMSMCASLIASAVPAFRATKYNPATLLRE